MYSLVKKRFQAASPLSDYEQTIKTILIRYIQASGIEDANWCNIIEFLTFMITEMINFDSLHPEKPFGNKHGLVRFIKLITSAC